MSRGIEVDRVRAAHGAVEVLHGVSAHFPAGSMVALLGHNGAGKSSLLDAIAGTLPVSSGRVLWRGADITAWAPHQRVSAGLTVVPAGANVFMEMTVADNLAIFGGGTAPDLFYEVFPELAGRAGQQAATLSGGERQMLALGRVIRHRGTALLLDEVSRGLSANAIARLDDVLAA